MACEDSRELLERYAADELPAGAMLSVEAHVAQCAECAERLHDLLTLDAVAEDALKMLPPEPPADLRARISLLLPPQDALQSDTCYCLGVQMSALLDGELTAEEEAELRSHVASCAVCERELGGLRRLQTNLAHLDVRPPRSLVRRLRRVAREAGVPAFRPITMEPKVRPGFVGAFAVAATAAVVFVAGYHLGALRMQSATRHERPIPVALGTPTGGNTASPDSVAPALDVPRSLPATTSSLAAAEVMDESTMATVAPPAADAVVKRAAGSMGRLVRSGANLIASLPSADVHRRGAPSSGSVHPTASSRTVPTATGVGGARVGAGESRGGTDVGARPSGEGVSNLADEGLRLIERAWNSVLPAAGGAQGEGARVAKAAHDPIVVDAVTVAGTPTSAEDEFEPTASANLY